METFAGFHFFLGRSCLSPPGSRYRKHLGQFQEVLVSQILIGDPVRGYSTALVWEDEEFSVKLGNSNSGAYGEPQPVATFNVWGVHVVLTDKDKYAQLRALCKAKCPADIRQMLGSLVMQYMAAHPEVFTKLLDDRYAQGVRDGKREKIREIRKVLEV